MNIAVSVKDETVWAIAAAILDECNGDIQLAIPILEKRAIEDNNIFTLLMRPLLRYACSAAIRKVCHRERKRIWDGTPKAAPKLAIVPKIQPPSSAALLSNERARTAGARLLLDFPLPGGLPLRMASKPDVEKAAQFYRLQSKDMAAKFRWLDRLAKAMVGTKKVGDVYSEAKLRAMQAETSE